MYTFEHKVDLIMKYITTSNKTEKAELKKAMVEILQSEEAPDTSRYDDIVEIRIMDILKKVGTPPSLIGYNYAIQAVKFAIADPSYLRDITKRLYPDIAAVYNTTPSRVERAIRHAVEVIFDRGDMDNIVSVFGNTMSISKGKLTNSEFIAAVANEVNTFLKENRIM
jgi:two-component system response regulator (stage 0 sporulation protein A)